MDAVEELRSRSIAERLQAVEDLWDSIARDQEALPDDPALIDELRKRRARYLANPQTGVSWEEAKKQIRGGTA